jgi:hypothetical protein
LAQGTQIVWTRQAFELLLQITSQLADFSSLEKAFGQSRELSARHFPRKQPILSVSKIETGKLQVLSLQKETYHRLPLRRKLRHHYWGGQCKKASRCFR